jgi:hypothetical protein
MRDGRGPERLLVSALLLVAGAAAAVGASSSRDKAAAARSREFQQATGGLGLGTSVDLSRCPYGFDPRLSPACESRWRPDPGAGSTCPKHKSSLP